MEAKAAAQFIRHQLRDATDEQIEVLGTARRKARWDSRRPAFPKATTDRLLKSIRAAGYEPSAEMDRIRRYVWAGMTKSNVLPQQERFLGAYTGVVALRSANAKVLQSADLEAQAVYFSLLADPTFLVSDREVIQRSWNKAGLALPKVS
jgi:hypothetical protein